MSEFSYKAINQNGKTESGIIEADSVDGATNLLAAKGYIPTHVSPSKSFSFKKQWRAIDEKLSVTKIADLILFTKQFRVLLKAGLPIVSLLQTLESQTEDAKLKKTVKSIGESIREGNTLYESFKKHPAIFSDLYCNMVRAGEASGSLPEVLNRLTYIIEHDHKIQSDIKSALQYPKIVLATLTLAFFALLTFVIPKFIKIFENARIELPLPTRICVVLYNGIVNYWYIGVGVVLIVTLLWKRYIKTEQGQFMRDKTVLRIPIIGPLLQKAIMARFSSIFSILNSSGVPLLETVTIVSATIGNAAISREFNNLVKQLNKGKPMSSLLASSAYFPPLVTNMISVGEESGNLPEMLNEISAHYDDEVNYTIKGLSEALTPMLIGVLTVVVGFFALAIFLPMWDLTKMAK